MAAVEGEGSEVSVANAYCVVYRLEKSEWIVTGEGWAQVHLYKDTNDGTYRLVGWTVQDYNVVCNCNVTLTCKYKKKSSDFHKFTDEDDNVFGFGFYKKEESIEESERFMATLCKTIDELIKAAGLSGTVPAAPSAPSVAQMTAAAPLPTPPATSSSKPGSAIAAKSAALGGIKYGAAAATPPLVSQGSFNEKPRPKPPALPPPSANSGSNNAQSPTAAGGSSGATPPSRPSVSHMGSSGKIVPAPPAPRRSMSHVPSSSNVTPAPGTAPAAPSGTAGATGSGATSTGAKPPPRKPTHTKTMSTSQINPSKVNEPAKTSDFSATTPAGGTANGGKPRPPPMAKALSTASTAGGKPMPPAGPPPTAASGTAAGGGAVKDSKEPLSPKQAQMTKMEELAIVPKTHRTASIAMDMIYENKQVPLGKLKILPPKKAKKYADTATRPIITDPYGIIHTQHVKYDAETRSYQGLPPEWESQLNKQFGLPPTQVETVKLPEYKGRIPVVLEQMKKYLFANGGLQVEGIFRLAPDGDESSYVKQQLNANKFVKCSDVNCISNLLKVWFRDLPVHLLNDIKPEAIQAVDNEDQAGRVITAELADPNQSIFMWLLDMCIEVAKYSNVNKMTPQNLAIVIGPNLFTPQMTDPMASLMFSQKVANFLHKSILWRKKTTIDAA